MASGDPTPVTIDVDALGGAAPAGLRLRVRVVDATSVGEAPIELASIEVDRWDGEACRLELNVPPLADNRDYVVLAQTGFDDQVAVGDWITMDTIRIVDQVAHITLHQV